MVHENCFVNILILKLSFFLVEECVDLWKPQHQEDFVEGYEMNICPTEASQDPSEVGQSTLPSVRKIAATLQIL